MFFTNFTTPATAKTEYHRLANLHHPDHGGDLETMKLVNIEYASFLAGYARTEAYSRQTAAHAAGKTSAADYHDMNVLYETLKAKILDILNLSKDIQVELCGLWIWVTGETKPVKDAIHAAGFKYSGQKAAWYFAGVPSFGRHNWSLDKIRNYHGSTVFTRRDDDLAAA